MHVDIKEGIAEVTYNKGKKFFKKTITLASFISAMISDHGIRTPLLPLGTRYYVKKDNIHILYLEIPAMVRNVRYINRSDKKIFEGPVPLPWAIMKVQVLEKDEKHFEIYGDAWLYGMKKPLTSMQDQLYFFPVPNIYGDNRICWGSTFEGSLGKLSNLAEAGRVIDIYFSSNFNTDLAPRIGYYERYEDFLRDNTDKKSFNNEWLSSCYKSFGSIV